MNRSAKFFVCLSFSLLFLATDSFAQWDIEEEEQLYRIRVWRRVDLREKQNKGFFARGRELTKFILEGIESGEITDIYRDETYTENMGKAGFLKGIEKTAAKPSSPWDAQVTYNFGEFVTFGGKTYSSQSDGNFGTQPPDPFMWAEADPASLSASTFVANEFALIEVIEDVIFDKRRSRLYYDIEAIKLVVPGDIVANSPIGSTTDTPFGVIKYDDLEPLLRSRDEAKWVNRYNPKEWKNFADAFLLRLFSGPIIQYENPDGELITDMFPRHWDAVEEMYRYEMYLMEKEHNLWEY